MRGEFTREVFERLGYPNLFVSGCPSMYFNGSNFQVSYSKVERESFLAIFNGDKNKIIKYLEKFPESKAIFVEQCAYYNIIHYMADEVSLQDITFEYKYLDSNDIDLLRTNRIRLFLNYKQWADEILKIGASLSYGSRIHGNIVPILNGIPCFVDVIDSRTRELCEFYKIPNSYNTPYKFEPETIYDLYQSLDWTEFNENYKVRFANFANFLKEHNLDNVFGHNDEYKALQDGLEFSYPSSEDINATLDKFEPYMRRWDYFNSHPMHKAFVRILRGLIPSRDMRHRFYTYMCGTNKNLP